MLLLACMRFNLLLQTEPAQPDLDYIQSTRAWLYSACQDPFWLDHIQPVKSQPSMYPIESQLISSPAQSFSANQVPAQLNCIHPSSRKPAQLDCFQSVPNQSCPSSQELAQLGCLQPVLNRLCPASREPALHDCIYPLESQPRSSPAPLSPASQEPAKLDHFYLAKSQPRSSPAQLSQCH